MSNKNINEANTNPIGKWSSFLMQCYTELHDAVHQDKKNQGVFCTEPQDLSCSQNIIIHLLSIEMKKISMVNKNKKIKRSNVTLLRHTWFHQFQVVYKALYAQAIPTYIDYEQSLFFLGRANCKWPRVTEGVRRERHKKRETTCEARENGLSLSGDFLARKLKCWQARHVKHDLRVYLNNRGLLAFLFSKRAAYAVHKVRVDSKLTD